MRRGWRGASSCGTSPVSVTYGRPAGSSTAARTSPSVSPSPTSMKCRRCCREPGLVGSDQLRDRLREDFGAVPEAEGADERRDDGVARDAEARRAAAASSSSENRAGS